jgi:hypothetical protein
MNQINGVLNGIVRKKDDSFCFILADRRFSQEKKLEMLPSWILQNMDEVNKGITSNQVKTRVNKFLKGIDHEKVWKKIDEEHLGKHFANMHLKPE